MPGDSDVESYLRVLAGYTDGHGIDETVTSNATSLIKMSMMTRGFGFGVRNPTEDQVLKWMLYAFGCGWNG